MEGMREGRGRNVERGSRREGGARVGKGAHTST